MEQRMQVNDGTLLATGALTQAQAVPHEVAAVIDLAVGQVVTLDGEEWKITALDFIFAQVTVRRVSDMADPDIAYGGEKREVPFLALSKG